MTLTDLSRELLGCIRDDADITAWCQDNYSKALTLFLGYNQEAPPKADSVPFVMVSEGQLNAGLETHSAATLSLSWGVSSPDVTTVDGITELKGSLLSEELGNLIVSAISVPTGEHSAPDVEITPALATAWAPLFPGEMTVSVNLR